MGFSELVFIMILGLILFGPEELPKVARGVGKIIYEIKKASEDVTDEIKRSVATEPVKPFQSGRTENAKEAVSEKDGAENGGNGNDGETTDYNIEAKSFGDV